MTVPPTGSAGRPSSNARLPRTTLLVAAMLLITGCRAWHTKSPNRQAELTTFPKPVRVKLLDGSDVVLTDVRIERDTLFGYVQRGTADTTAIPRAFPMTRVDAVQVREISASRTVALTAGTALALRAGIYVLGYALFSGIE